MHKVEKIVTNDGMSFDTESQAKKYLDNKYGNLLTDIAHNILRYDKYTELLEFLDNNIEIFAKIIELKRELKEGIEPDTD